MFRFINETLDNMEELLLKEEHEKYYEHREKLLEIYKKQDEIIKELKRRH